MEKKELKERFFDRFFYAEDGPCDWDRWRNQDPSVVLEFILEELDRARKEGYEKGVGDGMKGKVFSKVEIKEEAHIPKELIEKIREEGRREVIHKLKEEIDMAEVSKFIDTHQDFFNSFGKSMLLKISKLNKKK